MDFGPAGPLPTPATRTDAKTLGGPNMLAIDPDSGRLFVSDSTATNGVNRVMVFTPPFSNAMAALNCTALGARGGIRGVAEVRSMMARAERRSQEEFAARAAAV